MGEASIGFRRAVKGIRIAARIQAEGDEPPAKYQWAANNPYNPRARQVLEPFTTHCNQYPSYRTWEIVAGALMFDVVDPKAGQFTGGDSDDS